MLGEERGCCIDMLPRPDNDRGWLSTTQSQIEVSRAVVQNRKQSSRFFLLF